MPDLAKTRILRTVAGAQPGDVYVKKTTCRRHHPSTARDAMWC